MTLSLAVALLVILLFPLCAWLTLISFAVIFFALVLAAAVLSTLLRFLHAVSAL